MPERAAREGHLLAIDLGCTKAIVAVADAEGSILASERIATQVEEGAASAAERLAAALGRVCAEAGLEPAAAAGLGIGAPGPLDRERGVLHDPPQMPWGEAPLVELLREHLGPVPARIDNDCKVGGIGEHRFGAARGARDVVYFGVGTGIGGCVIVDGRVQYGASDNASELGHLKVWMHGPQCGCGAHGCLEGLASGSGIERRARRAIAAGRETVLTDRVAEPDLVGGADIAQAAADGDSLSKELLEDALDALAAAIGSMMSALSPEVVVVGGGIAARNGQDWVDELERRARAAAFGPNADATRIVGPELGEHSVLLGAVALAQEAAAATPAGAAG